MILASAQTNPKRFDINANLNDHYKLIELAVENGAELILFPELSITGYEREKAKEMVFKHNDSRLNELRKLSAKKNIIVIIGAPIQINNELYIGAFILKPDNTISIYTKQFLHTEEEISFNASSDYNPLIEIDNERFSIAICADIKNPLHPENASNVNTTIYLASIFYTPGGISEAYENLSDYSMKYKMNILMSNYCGQSFDLDAAGKSGFWDKNGKLVSNLNDIDSGLLIVEGNDDNWIGKTIKYE